MKTYTLKKGDGVLIAIHGITVHFSYEELVSIAEDKVASANKKEGKDEGKKSSKQIDEKGTAKKKIAAQVNAAITGPYRANRSEGKDPHTDLEKVLQNILDYHDEHSEKSKDLSPYTIAEAKEIMLEILEKGIFERLKGKKLSPEQDKRRLEAIEKIKSWPT